MNQITYSILPSIQKRFVAALGGEPRYKTIADLLAHDIASGRISPGRKLPTVRQLSKLLQVSDTTIASAYRLLRNRGCIYANVGDGTYVSQVARIESITRHLSSSEELSRLNNTNEKPSHSILGRRRTLTLEANRLRLLYPLALDCTSGRPDQSLVPLEPLKKAWQSAVAQINCPGLAYSSPDPEPALVAQLLPRLARDGISVTENNLLAGASAQQLIMLALRVAQTIVGHSSLVVAVEQPGYPTILDSCDRAGYQLVGLQVDEHGATPESLERVLLNGAEAVLLTPRAHNPTGASWTVARKNALAEILVNHSEVLVIEDDYFADLAGGPRTGSLISDPRLKDRVMYVRSFSKSIAPDLRLAVGVAQIRLRNLLLEEKSFSDGWTSRLTQNALSNLLSDPDLDLLLQFATKAYQDRRRAATVALITNVGSIAQIIDEGDGVSLWVSISTEVPASEVIQKCAEGGVLVSNGTPFFIESGYGNAVRFNAGAANSIQQASFIGQSVATAIKEAALSSSRFSFEPHV